MALQYNELVEAQTKNPPQYGQEGQVISIDQLQPAKSLSVPTAVPMTGPTPDSLVEGAVAGQASINDIIKSLTPAQTEADTKNQAFYDRMLEITGQLNNKPSDLFAAQKEAGALTFKKQLAEYNGLVTKGAAEYNALVAKEQAQKAALEANSRGLTSAVLTGQQGAVERQALAERALKSSEITMNSAMAQAAAGNLTAALQMASDANNAKYAPLENEYKLIELQQKALKETVLDKQEKIQLAAAEEKLRQDQQVLADKKANEKAIQEMIINALPQGAPQELVDQASKAKNSIEAAKILGKYSGDYLKYELLKEQIKSENVNRNLVAERIKTEKAQQSNYYANIAKTKAETDAINNPTQSVPGEYQSALNVILGSSKFTKEQKASITNAIQSGQNPVSVIKNQAKDIMGQTEATALSKLETAAAQLKSIDSSLKQFYAAGGKTGLFKGNYEEVVNKLGKVDDPKLVTLATQMAVAMQKYRLAVTGTASSVKEDARIENIFPGINNSQGLNQARLNGLLQSFDTDIESTYRNVLGSSYDEIKNAEASSDPNNPFNKALGGSGSQPIQGASILTGTNSDGTLNFNIPGYKPIGEMLKK